MENDEAAIIQNVRSACQLQAPRPFGRVKDSAEVLLDRPLSGPVSLTFRAA